MTLDHHPDHHLRRELIHHGIAYCIAAAIGAVILYHYYWFFEANTESASQARDVYLTCIAIVGGVGPVVTFLFLWLRRLFGG